MVFSLLISEDGDAQTLGESFKPQASQDFTHQMFILENGIKLLWSSSNFEHNLVNEVASRLAQQIIKGDVILFCSNWEQVEKLHKDLKSRRPSIDKKILECFRDSSLQQEASYFPCLSGCQLPLEQPHWGDLPPDIIGLVALALPDTAASLLPLSMVCVAWRQALLQNKRVMIRIWFNLDPYQPFSKKMVPDSQQTVLSEAPAESVKVLHRHRFLLGLEPSDEHGSKALGCGLTVSHRRRRGKESPLKCPHTFLTAAANLGNLSAMGVMAQLHEVDGSDKDSLRWWTRCAKGGDLEGMLKVGFALYHGKSIDMDSEGAHKWLSKALRKLLNISNLSQISTPLGSQSGQSALELANATAQSPALSVSCYVTGQEKELMQMLARAALVLGYLHLDGEGIRADAGEAIRLFKLAASCGSREGERVLGWMWNTGQY